MEESMRIRILGDASSAQTAFQQAEKAAQLAADKISHSFNHLGSLFKRTIGFAGIAVGLDTALESASHLINAQKAQAQLLSNQAKQQGSIIKLQDFELEGNAKAYAWKSKTLDQMATQLSLNNAISKSDIVQAQNRQLTNTDLLKFYSKGNAALSQQNQTYKDIVNEARLHGVAMSGSQAAMATTLTTAANLAEVTGQGINGSMMMLTRLMADPAKRMSAMSRMGIQIAKSDQERIKALEKTKGLMAAQGELLNVLDKTYHGIAATAASPVEILKNALANVWTALGEGLMPVLESLSAVVIEVVTPLLPVLQSMGSLIEEVAKRLGTSLGSLISDLIPFIDLLVKGMLPAFFDLITPLVQMADKAITPLAQAFSQLVGEGEKMGPLSQAFLDMGKTIGENLKPAVDFIADAFKKMSKDGTLDKMMKSLLDTFKALAPILPDLAVALANLVIAITPAFIAALPIMVDAFALFVQILTAITPLVVDVANGIADLVKKITDNKGLTGVIGTLIGLWFTKSLFITPLVAITSGIGMIITKIISAGSALKGVGSIAKGLFTKGFGGASAARLGSLDRRADIATSKATAAFGMYGGESGRYKRAAAKQKEAVERAEAFRGRVNTVAGAGGGVKGLLKSVFGFGLGTGFKPASEVDAVNQNTQALIELTATLGRTAGGLSGGFGSGGSGKSKPMTDLEKTYAELHARQYGGSSGRGAIPGLQSLQTALAENGYAGKNGKPPSGGKFGRFGSFMKNEFSAMGEDVRNGAARTSRIGSKIAGFGRLGRFSAGSGIVGGLASAGIGMAMPLLQKVMPKKAANVLGGVAQGASMGMMFGPWGAAIGAAIGLVKSLFQNCKPFHDFVIKVGHKLMEWGKIIWTKVQPVLKVVWEIIKKIATIYIKAMIFGFKIVWGVIKMVWNVLKTVWDVLYAIGKWVVGVLMAYFKGWWTIIKAVWGILSGIWDGLVSGGKTAWGWLKGMFGWIKDAGGNVWDALYNGFVWAVNKIIGLYNGTLGNLLSWIGVDAKIGTLTYVDHHSKPKKHHSGGIVQGPRGKEVPAILQAGEAVTSLAQMNAGRNRGAGNTLNVQPNAVTIVVNGNADAATTAEIKKHVDAQFKELHRTLRGMGR